ncbi:cystatin-like protein [Pygocentrus nattereri]|uniref:Cystatin domain-containing protein n=1 Tax=Pygocentrus nattereri TaxID=42514 RepID=A0AAR2KYW1_PYGNA|nr:cystatin-like protein [Pygocentrus nattereri]XP_037401956.1 cystatin-like protein [Pygocentrus nattereri]
MSAVLKLLLLSAVTLLVSAQGSENYQNLSESIRIHIDKALDKANEYFTNHYVAYESLLSEPKITADDFYVNVRLMVTTCKKDKEKGYGHRVECVKQKPKTPRINCLVCKKKNGEELIDCVRQKDAKSREDIRSSCPTHPRSYLHGEVTLMSQTGGDDGPQIGCPGCV